MDGPTLAIRLFALILLTGCGQPRVEQVPNIPNPTEPSSTVPIPPTSGPWFVNRAPEFGLNVETLCGDPSKQSVLDSVGIGVALFDLDRDNDLDLFVAAGSRIHEKTIVDAGGPWLFRNDGPGRWTDITKDSRLLHTGWAQGVAVADYDADRDLDLFIAQYGRDTLWQNQGNGRFIDVTETSGIDEKYWGVSATWGDIDNDGWPDLYVTNYLEVDAFRPPPLNDYLPGHPVFEGPVTLPGQPDQLWRNRGDGTFEEYSSEAGLQRGVNKGMSALFVDLNDDNNLDLYVTNDTQANELFQGLGKGRFQEIGKRAGVSYNLQGVTEGSMAIAVADVDRNQTLDLMISNFRQEGSRLYQNLGDHNYRDQSGRFRLWDLTAEFVGWGLILRDFDHDGWPDLFQVNGHVYPGVPDSRYDQSAIMLQNLNGTGFELVTSTWGNRLHECRSGRAVAVGDLEPDGDLDLVVSTMDGPLSVWVNEGTSENHSVLVRLIGSLPNTEAIGARVTIEAGKRSYIDVVRRGGSILAASDAALHYGLGIADQIDHLRIRWPDSTTDNYQNLPVDSLLTIHQQEHRLDAYFFDELPKSDPKVTIFPANKSTSP